MAAIVTGVNADGSVNLQVFPNQVNASVEFFSHVPFNNTTGEGWHWPERE